MSDTYTVLKPTDDTITLSSVGAVGNGMTASITNMGAVSGTIYAGPYTVTTGSNTPWMTSTLGQASAPKIRLDGEGADIEVNGWSLVNAIKKIEERLGLFQLNPELEAEWSELQALGEQYRKLEQYIRDKQATWDKLKG